MQKEKKYSVENNNKNYNLALLNINQSINNAQLLFITGILFTLGFSVINFKISDYLTPPIIVFLFIWAFSVIRFLKKPLLYKND